MENDPYHKQSKVISDSNLSVMGVKEKRYHLECQSSPDQTILLRIFEYGSAIALSDANVVDHTLDVNYPEAALIYLRYPGDTPEQFRIRIHTRGGTVSYDVPILKINDYDLMEILEKKLRPLTKNWS